MSEVFNKAEKKTNNKYCGKRWDNINIMVEVILSKSVIVPKSINVGGDSFTNPYLSNHGLHLELLK